MIFVLSVHVKNIRTSSEVTQILHSWGPPDLCLQRVGELSFSEHAPVGPEVWAIFIGTSRPLPLEIIMPFQVPGAGINVYLLKQEEMYKGIALNASYGQVSRNATLRDRHQPSCSQIIRASESNLQISADGRWFLLRLRRPLLFYPQ